MSDTRPLIYCSGLVSPGIEDMLLHTLRTSKKLVIIWYPKGWVIQLMILIVCSAASSSGLSVLHLDNESEYGSHWAGLTLENFLEWAANSGRIDDSAAEVYHAKPQQSSSCTSAFWESFPWANLQCIVFWRIFIMTRSQPLRRLFLRWL